MERCAVLGGNFVCVEIGTKCTSRGNYPCIFKPRLPSLHRESGPVLMLELQRHGTLSRDKLIPRR
jgi:hypothetical protein